MENRRKIRKKKFLEHGTHRGACRSRPSHTAKEKFVARSWLCRGVPPSPALVPLLLPVCRLSPPQAGGEASPTRPPSGSRLRSAPVLYPSGGAFAPLGAI